MNTKGIIILALHHPYYGRMAHNLAVSIKANEPEIPIALLHDEPAISHLKIFDLRPAFDQMIPVPPECFTRNGKQEFIRAKTCLYDLSPFDETLYLDADMIWLHTHKPSELFTQFKDIDFTISNKGTTTSDNLKDKYLWAKYSDIVSAYGFKDSEKYYRVSSEFIFFRKNERIEKLFRRWQHNYDDLKVTTETFAGGIPDELPLAIAMMQENIYPHADKYTPIYWQSYEKQIYDDLYNRFYAISAGGKVTGEWTKKNYDRLVKHYFNGAGLRYIWELQNKRRFLPERVNI